MGDEPITARECAAIHAGVGQGLEDIKRELIKLNNSVAKNTQFRLQQKAVYGVIAFAWISVLIPLAAIAVAVLV